MESVQHLGHQRTDGGWIAPDELRGDHLFDRRNGAGDDVVAEGLAPADDPFVGFDLHEQSVDGGPGSAAEARRSIGWYEGDADDNRFDRGDFHEFQFAVVVRVWEGVEIGSSASRFRAPGMRR